MESGIIALIVIAGLVTLATTVALIRQFLLSYDKNVNDKNQKEVLNQFSKENEKIRNHMENPQRMGSYHQMLGINKKHIDYLNKETQKTFVRKSRLMELYHLYSLHNSTEHSMQDNQILEQLKNEIGKDIAFYNTQLQQLQKREETQWAIQNANKQAMIEQLQSITKNSDALYEKQTTQLEKIFLRVNETTQQLAVENIHAGTEDFKSILMAPIQLFLRYFNLMPNVMLAPPQITFIGERRETNRMDENLSMNQEYGSSVKSEYGVSTKKISASSSGKTDVVNKEELDPDLDSGIRLIFA